MAVKCALRPHARVNLNFELRGDGSDGGAEVYVVDPTLNEVINDVESDRSKIVVAIYKLSRGDESVYVPLMQLRAYSSLARAVAPRNGGRINECIMDDYIRHAVPERPDERYAITATGIVEALRLLDLYVPS